MQVSQADIAKGCRVGTEEKYISFRPSPNFKNMKKFLKSKIDFMENSNHSPVHDADISPTNTSPGPITSLEEQRLLLEKAQPAQPPLPQEPPPTTLIDFSLPYKQEIEGHEYKSGSPSPMLRHREEISHNYETSHGTGPSEKPARTICRDFIRGTCTRVGCRFAHERDLSQLLGVYTFCKNFQNTVCTLPYCKYVHATIFEEQRFYRTGELPPHVFAHHKKPPAILPPPPPPPPPEEPAPPPALEVPMFLTPPPVLVPSVDKPIISCVPTANLESRPLDDFIKPAPPPALEVPMFLTPPPVLVPSVDKPIISCVPTANLESRPLDDFIINATPRDRDFKPKKCKSCDTMEFRLQFNKDKTENMIKSSIELKKKVALVTKKTQILYTVLYSLMKWRGSKRPEGLNGQSMSTLLNISGDSEKNVLSNLLLKEATEQNLMTETRDS